MPFNRHVPKALADYSVKCIQDRSVFGMGEVLAPTKKVGKETDAYFKYSVTEQFKKQSLIRADKARAQRLDLTELSSTQYVLANHSAAIEVSDRERANADPSVDPDFDAAQEITDLLLREKELDVAKTFFTSTSFSTNLLTLSSNAYDLDTVTSTPIDDARTATRGILQQCGQIANGVSMGRNTFDILIDHADVLDRIKWSERGIVGQDILAAVLGIDKVHVSDAVFNDSKAGLAASMTFMFNTKLLYFFNNSNPGKRNANLGTTFSGMFGGTEPTTKRYREEDIASDVLELNWMYDVELINSLSGYMISAAHS